MTRRFPRSSQRGTPELAQAYARRSHWQRARGLNLLDLAAPRRAQTVLDLGCGTGELTVELACRVGSRGRVWGIDPDATRLSRARALSAIIDGKIEYHQATAENMDPIPPGSVDLIYSNYVIHWVRDVPAMFDEVERVLKPYGRFVAEFVGAPIRPFDDLLRMMPDGDAIFTESTFLDDREWRAALYARKLEILTLNRLDLSVHFESCSELLDWLEATSHGAFQPSLLNTADQAYVKAKYPGRVTIPIEALCISLLRV